MSQAYTPGLQVTKHAKIRKIRELPIPGKALVKVGTLVQATTPVLSADLPGDLSIIRVADRMGLDPIDASKGLKVKDGMQIQKGQLLCSTKIFFGFFTTKLESPVSGVVEFITEANAHVGIRQAPVPLNISAYISGTVSEVDETKSVTIDSSGALIQGIFGVGGERLGIIHPLEIDNNATVEREVLDKIDTDLSNAILIGGARFTEEALKVAARRNVAAVVTGSIDANTLRNFVGHDIGVSITGDEEVPFTLIVTEGFGSLPISARITKLALTLQGKNASVNGATQVRAGAMRPEIIVPDTNQQAEAASMAQESRGLSVGTQIRIIRVPYFGSLGEVVELPQQPTEIPSGAKVRVLKARLESGEEVIVPRANVELLM